jgi:hypothetical protein
VNWNLLSIPPACLVCQGGAKHGSIPIVLEEDPATPPEALEFLKQIQGHLGEVFNPVRLFANHPQQAKCPHRLRAIRALSPTA